MKFAKCIAYTLLSSALMVPWAANGRVFQTIGQNDGFLNTAGLPWKAAYKTEMTVNGRKNKVRVYAARYNEPVVEQLTAQFESQGAKVEMRRGDDGDALGVATWDGGEARILVLPPNTTPNQVVFLFYPESGKAKAPAFPVPEYPRCVVSNTVVDDDTDTFCANLKTTDAPEQVLQYYAGALQGDGWEALLPLRLSSGMLMLHKQERTCCVLAKGGNNGETFVTLLVRNSGL